MKHQPNRDFCRFPQGYLCSSCVLLLNARLPAVWETDWYLKLNEIIASWRHQTTWRSESALIVICLMWNSAVKCCALGIKDVQVKHPSIPLVPLVPFSEMCSLKRDFYEKYILKIPWASVYRLWIQFSNLYLNPTLAFLPRGGLTFCKEVEKGCKNLLVRTAFTEPK